MVRHHSTQRKVLHAFSNPTLTQQSTACTEKTCFLFFLFFSPLKQIDHLLTAAVIVMLINVVPLQLSGLGLHAFV